MPAWRSVCISARGGMAWETRKRTESAKCRCRQTPDYGGGERGRTRLDSLPLSFPNTGGGRVSPYTLSSAAHSPCAPQGRPTLETTTRRPIFGLTGPVSYRRARIQYILSRAGKSTAPRARAASSATPGRPHPSPGRPLWRKQALIRERPSPVRPSGTPPLVDSQNPSQSPFAKGRGLGLPSFKDGLPSSFVVPMVTGVLTFRRPSGSRGACRRNVGPDDQAIPQELPQSMEMEVKLRATGLSGARFARKNMEIRQSN